MRRALRRRLVGQGPAHLEEKLRGLRRRDVGLRALEGPHALEEEAEGGRAQRARAHLREEVWGQLRLCPGLYRGPRLERAALGKQPAPEAERLPDVLRRGAGLEELRPVDEGSGWVAENVVLERARRLGRGVPSHEEGVLRGRANTHGGETRRFRAQVHLGREPRELTGQQTGVRRQDGEGDGHGNCGTSNPTV